MDDAELLRRLSKRKRAERSAAAQAEVVRSWADLRRRFGVSTLQQLGDALEDAADIDWPTCAKRDVHGAITVVVGTRGVTLDYPFTVVELFDALADAERESAAVAHWGDLAEQIELVEGFKVVASRRRCK